MSEPSLDVLAKYLADRDEPCPSCRYSLRGLQGAVCPECGQELMIRVGLVEPRLAAWLFGLVGISAGLGFCALMTTYFLLTMLQYGWDIFGDINGAFITLVLGIPFGITALVVWLKSRRRLCRASSGTRWTLATVATVLMLAFPITFLVWIP